VTDEERAKQRVYFKKYRLVNHEKLLARKKAAYPKYYAKHGEETKVRVSNYYATNCEKIKRHKSEFYAMHLETEKARSAKYAVEHPEERQLASLKRRALKYDNTPIAELLTGAQWRDILDQYGHRCAYCGRKMEKLTVDHAIPLSRGGKHSKDNVVPACQHCNAVKNVKTPSEWVGLEVTR
jgi:5-methylcytosine-specific restriction endonuclease McrA